MSRRPMKGLSLIELMVVLAVIGVMLMLAAPGFGNWTRNSRIRTIAEEVQNGLRLAQAEAVNRNRRVAFVRTNATPARNAAPATNGTNWYVQVLPLPSEVGDAAFDATSYVQGGAFSSQVGATVGGQALHCFNAAGRVINDTTTGLGADCVAPADAANPEDIDVTLAGGDRSMRVELFLGGRVRMCDVNAASGQPNACTP
jgi:type IV fimbrial biogenesis protein FimT